ncbi:GNAT family N-acetyltransferase [Hymenobacter daeguensis]
MTIEPLQPADAPRVAAFVLGIQNGEFNLGFAPHEQPDLLDLAAFYATGGFWVAKADGELVGTIGLQRLDARTGILRKMFVKKEWRGTSARVAQQLFDHLVPVARQLGFATIYLDTPAVATASHRFYERNGFEEVTDTRTLPAAYRYPDRNSRVYRLTLGAAPTPPFLAH